MVQSFYHYKEKRIFSEKHNVKKLVKREATNFNVLRDLNVYNFN